MVRKRNCHSSISGNNSEKGLSLDVDGRQVEKEKTEHAVARNSRGMM